MNDASGIIPRLEAISLPDRQSEFLRKQANFLHPQWGPTVAFIAAIRFGSRPHRAGLKFSQNGTNIASKPSSN